MRKFFIRSSTHYAGEHNLYEGEAEFRKDWPDRPIYKWARDPYEQLKIGDWVESEDGYIVECLYIRKLVNRRSQVTYMIRFPNYAASIYIRKDGSPKFSRYYASITSLDSRSLSNSFIGRAGELTKKLKFAALIAAGLPLRKAYMLSFPVLTPLGISNNKLVRIMNDKVVITQLRDIFQVMKNSIDNKFSNERLIQELDDLLTHSEKGTDAHRKNIQYILELKGLLKTKADGSIEDAEFSEPPPFESDHQEKKE